MTTRLRHTRLALAGSAVFCSVILAATGTAVAIIPTMDVSPTSLHAGESFSVAGHCSDDKASVVLISGWVSETEEADDAQLVTYDDFTNPENGFDWSGELEVPIGTAPGAYTLVGNCYGSVLGGYDYLNVQITVLADEATTTTTTMISAPPITDAPTSTVAAVTAPQAVAAAPVTAQPTYTG